MILPPPDPSFEWRQTPFGPALVCKPLETVAAHVWTTRFWRLGQAGIVDNPGWIDVAAALELDGSALVRLHQVHGRTVVVADQDDRRESHSRPNGDILLGSDSGTAIAVQVADCVPLLIADRRLGVVAAAHAGWRGLALGVPVATVQAMVDTYGSEPRDLVAAIGPAVGACCYEVGPEVRQAFVEGGFPGEAIGRWFLPAPAPITGNPPMPGLPETRRPGHWYFDGWGAARAQLLAAGLARSEVFSARLCTASHPAVFPSYRRDGHQSGRSAAAIRPLRRR
ncbi:MAG TPA: peptidoglycan editing factor PgeF [Vicinamibacterales bacterium]|nr:peptidoglycan editing factor PgeF [Vicinamibacterales bacterium]